MTATQTVTLTQSEFTALITDAIAAKRKGELLEMTRGDYTVKLAGCEGTYRITVTGGPKDSWTRRQNVAPENVARTIPTLFAELGGHVETATEAPAAAVAPAKASPAPVAPQSVVDEARELIAAARTSIRIYGPNSRPGARAAANARQAIAKALQAGATEAQLLAN